MTPAERLAALRAALRQAGVEGFLIPRADEHLGEYVPPSGERLAWLTGFTGSAGLAVVLDDRAALFTDGRYTTQAQQQLDPALWELRHIIEQPRGGLAEGTCRRPAHRLRSLAAPGSRAEAAGAAPAVTLVAAAGQPAGCRLDRPPGPAPGAGRAASAGLRRRSRRRRSAPPPPSVLREAGEDAAVLADSHSLAWLFNIRGGDLAHTPLALGFSLLRADGSARALHGPGQGPGRDARASRQCRDGPPARGAAGGAARAGRARRCGWIPRRRRPGSPRRCAPPVPTSPPATTRCACRAPARMRSSRRGHAPRIGGMRWRWPASSPGSPPPRRGAGNRDERRRPAARLPPGGRRCSRPRASPPSAAPASMAPSSTTARRRRATGRSAPTNAT